MGSCFCKQWRKTPLLTLDSEEFSREIDRLHRMNNEMAQHISSFTTIRDGLQKSLFIEHLTKQIEVLKNELRKKDLTIHHLSHSSASSSRGASAVVADPCDSTHTEETLPHLLHGVCSNRLPGNSTTAYLSPRN